MTIFGFKEAEIATLVRAVTRDDLTRDEIVERVARAAWSVLTEPGDRIAAQVIAELGAAPALAAIMSGAPLAGATPDELAEADARWRPRLKQRAVELALSQAGRFGARLRVPSDDDWPAQLDDLGPHAPLALWTRGVDAALAHLDRSIALVGARAATGYGEHVTMEASAGLVDRGYAIVSGAAYGIDGMAHRAALASGGHTIAFLAGGVDRFYPAGHDELLGRIVERGLVVSELPCGQPPTRWRFLQRNRLIAASSLATVVLEAGWRSGSLNTANHAQTLGRPIGAVPGPVTSSASAGCHALVRSGWAHLVTNADEMAQLAPLPGQPEPEPGATPRERSDHVRVMDALSSRSPRSVVDVAARAGLSTTDTAAVLAVLELDGRVEERESGWRRVDAPG